MFFFKRNKNKDKQDANDSSVEALVEETTVEVAIEDSVAEGEQSDFDALSSTPLADVDLDEEAPESEPQKKLSLFGRIKQGLTRTRKQFAEGLGNLLLGKKQIDDELLEEIETQLLVADVGLSLIHI